MLTLIVPGLLWPTQALADLTHDLPLPAFSALLGRGRLQRLPASGATAWIAAATGLPEPLPAAALRMETPDAADWLALDPVHLRFEGQTMIVDDPAVLALSSDEAEQLAVALAPTFSALGSLRPIRPLHWNLRLTDGLRTPAFTPLPDAVLRRAEPLPLDPDYRPWRQALNEAQMVLHTHPVNKAREASRRPVVNSLWPWGAGGLPAPTRSCSHDALWANDPVLLGIGRLHRIDATPLPDTLPEMAGTPLAVIDTLDLATRSGNGLAWREGMNKLETDWLAPLLSALRGGRLAALRMIAPDPQGNVELLVRRQDMWKLWRKPRPLTCLANPS